jgi:predicted metal-dependent hydrolase
MSMAEEKLQPAACELACKLLRRVHARQLNAKEDALSLACEVAERFPEPPSVEAATFVTTQLARWGSYSMRTKTIRLNAALRSMPRWVLKAIVAHELAHVFHADHSPAFWELLRRVCPETDRAEAFLAGVSWFARNVDSLPLAERELLDGTEGTGDPP